MNQETLDQGLQQLQAHIAGFLNQALTNDIQSIEYKPRYIALLGTTSDQHSNDAQETTA